MNDKILHSINDEIVKHIGSEEFEITEVREILEKGKSPFKKRQGSELSFIVKVKKTDSNQKSTKNKPQKNENEIQLEDINYVLSNADVLLKSGEYVLARGLYRNVLKSGREPGRSLLGIAETFILQGKPEVAERAIRDAISYEPSPSSFLKLSEILIKRGDLLEASALVARAGKSESINRGDRYELLITLGNRFLSVDRGQEAIDSFETAIEVGGESSELLTNLAAAFLLNGNLTESELIFKRATQLDSKNTKALFGLGSCAVRRGNKSRAFDFFEKTLELDIQNPPAVYQIVKLAYELKSYGRAEVVLKRYLDTSPINSSLLYSLAGIQYHLRKNWEARITLQRLLSIKPNHEGGKRLLNLLNRK